ncbi:hypothetical protein [Paenibacillus borealis]|uniref:hypothetical protein n=1 Tax=Paenibacillus borealis TaxID=160799 RepID=UPI000A764FC4|nr:hypothetical protein [Paenibacillus borealis]
MLKNNCQLNLYKENMYTITVSDAAEAVSPVQGTVSLTETKYENKDGDADA